MGNLRDTVGALVGTRDKTKDNGVEEDQEGQNRQ